LIRLSYKAGTAVLAGSIRTGKKKKGGEREDDGGRPLVYHAGKG